MKYRTIANRLDGNFYAYGCTRGEKRGGRPVIVTEDDIRKLGWQKGYKEFEEKFDALKRKIAAVPGIKNDLRTLKLGKADPNLVLELLTGVVWDPPMSYWRKEVKWRQDQIMGVCDRVRCAREAVERVSGKSEYSPVFWMALKNRSSTLQHLKHLSVVPCQMIRQMRAYEDYCRAAAKMFGEIRRKQPQLNRNEEIGGLAAYIRHTTGKNHNEELARLLTDAYEAAGIRRKCFTADQIKKFRQRHLKIPSLLAPSSEAFWSSLNDAFNSQLSTDKLP